MVEVWIKENGIMEFAGLPQILFKRGKYQSPLLLIAEVLGDLQIAEYTKPIE